MKMFPKKMRNTLGYKLLRMSVFAYTNIRCVWKERNLRREAWLRLFWKRCSYLHINGRVHKRLYS